MAAFPAAGPGMTLRGWLSALRRRARGLRDTPTHALFRADEIEQVKQAYLSSGGGAGPAWEPLRDAHMVLPDWFEHDLDPYGEAYARQQHRLWQLMAGVDEDYDADQHEKEAPWGDIDAVRLPGFYVRRDAAAVTSA